METTTIKTIDFNVFKNDIKKLAEEQKFLKNQRKAVHIKGERVMDANKAAYKHMCNREDLRIMYAAYGLMRGKSFEQIEKKSIPIGIIDEHPLAKFGNQIKHLMDKYSKYTKDVEVKTE